MKRILLLLVILLPTPVWACGSPSMMLSGYWNPEADRRTKETLLESVGCGNHVNYFPLEDDPVIASVAIDAILEEFPRKSIEILLQHFHCAYAARHDEDYVVIRQFIGEEQYDEFCRTDELQHIYIVSVANGAVLRDAPDGARLGAIRQGAFVRLVAEADGWYQVDGGLYGNGYIRSDLVASY